MLPEPIAHELAFCVWRIIELGGLVPYHPARPLGAVAERGAGGAAERMSAHGAYR